MCGLMGYCGSSSAAPILVEGMKRLEYRGYDSAGVATLAEGQLYHRKDAGKLAEVEDAQHLSLLPGNTGIGHVRWATNGGISSANAHPQLDHLGQVAVVHNGIIENSRELIAQLSARHTFISQTDTEIIPHLIADYLHGGANLAGAARNAASQMQGPYAFLAISAAEPGVLVACCRDMPLLIGLGAGGNVAASDAVSFPEDCSRCMVLDHGETAVITPVSVRVFDVWAQEINKPVVEMALHWRQAEIDGFPHFMLKEILEQPWAKRQAMLQDSRQLARIAGLIRQAGNVVFTACGTSRHAALLGRYLVARVGAKMSEVIVGSEFRYFEEALTSDTVVVAISQSGETADVLDGVRASKARGARVVSIVNRPRSQLERLSDETLLLNCGPEMSVAATKSFSAQLVIMYQLAFEMVDRRRYIEDEIRKATELTDAMLPAYLAEMKRLADIMKARYGCYFIARGHNLHIASEAALKMGEVAYMYAVGMAAGELKHGSLAVVEKGTHLVAICPHDYTYTDMMTNVEETRARGASIIGVSDTTSPLFDHWVPIPTVPADIYPLVSIVPLQLLAYYSALARGLDPDRPRNLAKSVTVR